MSGEGKEYRQGGLTDEKDLAMGGWQEIGQQTVLLKLEALSVRSKIPVMSCTG